MIISFCVCIGICFSLRIFFLNLIRYFFLFLLRSRFQFGFYFAHIILPELVYTVVVTIVFYRVIRSLNHWLEKKEKEEGESKIISPVIPYNDNNEAGTDGQ